MSDAVRITRLTRGGTLQLSDEPFLARCGTCDARPAGERAAAPIGLLSTVTGGPTLRTSICADCLAEGLALLFGRRHVQALRRVARRSTRGKVPIRAFWCWRCAGWHATSQEKRTER